VTILLQVIAALEYPMKLAQAWTGNNACHKWTFVTCDSYGRVITVNIAKILRIATNFHDLAVDKIMKCSEDRQSYPTNKQQISHENEKCKRE